MTYTPDFYPDPEGEGEGQQPTSPYAGNPARKVSYKVNLDREKRQKLGERLGNEVRAYDQAVEQKRSLVQEFRRDWEMLSYVGPQPWPNASSLRAPLSRVAAAQHANRLNGLIANSARPFVIVPEDEVSRQNQDAIEQALRYHLQQAGFAQVAREVHQEIVSAAPVGVRVFHEEEKRRVPRLQVDLDEGVLEAAVQAGTPVFQALNEAVPQDAEGQLEAEWNFVEETIFDGVKLETVEWEDFVVLPVGAKNFKRAWGVGERIRLRGMDLLEGVESGRYLKDAVSELLVAGSDEYPERLQQDTLEFSGIEVTMDTATDHERYREYEVVHLAIYDDLDNDRKLEWYLVTVHPESNRILGVQYSPYEHGLPPYAYIQYIPRIRQLFGQTIVELLSTTQSAATNTANSFNDLVDLLVGSAGSPWIDEDANFDPGRNKFAPGTPRYCQDPKNNILPAVEAATIPPALDACLRGLELFKAWAEILAGSSNPVSGVPSETQKTAREVTIVQNNAMQIFEDYAFGVALQWAEVFDLFRKTLAQYAKDGMVQYEVEGEGGASIAEIPADLLKSKFKIVPAGLAEWADRQSRVQRDMMVHQLVSSDPALAPLVQVRLETLGQVIRDSGYPGAEQLIQTIEQALIEQQMAQMQAQAMMMGQQGAMQEEAAAQQQEDRQLSRSQALMGMAEQAQRMGAPTANGKGKGK